MENAESFARKQAVYSLLSHEDRSFWKKLTEEYRLTQMESRQLMIWLRDIQMWGEPSPADFWKEPLGELTGKPLRKAVLAKIEAYWEQLKLEGQDYRQHPPQLDTAPSPPVHFEEIKDDRNILGRCPVASEKTRCCNLYTLDAVFRCAYDCSYCSIQSFYDQGRISFHGNLREKLSALQLNKDKRYHIGTGQSSDSLLWGNRQGLLEELCRFAEEHPNVILELKTKSDNVQWLLENSLPKNLLVTWSLNTPAMIQWEERGTVSLERRLQAARACADKGIPIGFHFHPMVRYSHWESEYKELFSKVRSRFTASEMVLISLGTLTYIKPVLKKIRQRDFHSAILRMPMEEIAGRYSYPLEQKEELFRLALEELASWRSEVYFYLCMEDKALWPRLFGQDYPNNEAFEEKMLECYFQKMEAIYDGIRI